MNDYYVHMDVTMKYAFLVLGKHIHEFFNLEGEYCYNMGTEVIAMDKRNLRMDLKEKASLLNSLILVK